MKVTMPKNNRQAAAIPNCRPLPNCQFFDRAQSLSTAVSPILAFVKTIIIRSLSVAFGIALFASGCKPALDHPQVANGTKTVPGMAQPASAKLTFSNLPVPPKPEVTAQFIGRGKAVYTQNCLACHGTNGDGKSDAAAFLLPKPRNFVQANFRLRSTPTGRLPTDVDLFRSVSLGMPGTPMPPWRVNLSEDDRWAVVEYIKTFSPRFADTNEDRTTVISLGTPPARNEASVAEGKALFTKLACITCHGESGHGDGTSAATLVDDSQTKIRPRDFTKTSMFKSGYSSQEIARTILAGFNGTPMVGFHGTIPVADAWKLAYYVESFARPAGPATIARASQNFLARESLGEPDVRIKLTERAWQYDPSTIRVKKGQVVEVTFEPTDNGLGVGHGFAISGYDEAVFLNGAMVGLPKTARFRADRAGKFTYYCATQCSTEKLHPMMNGTLIVEDSSTKETASLH
jgi:cytochrome c oxidase cbb3-type subunit 2